MSTPVVTQTSTVNPPNTVFHIALTAPGSPEKVVEHVLALTLSGVRKAVADYKRDMPDLTPRGDRVVASEAAKRELDALSGTRLPYLAVQPSDFSPGPQQDHTWWCQDLDITPNNPKWADTSPVAPPVAPAPPPPAPAPIPDDPQTFYYVHWQTPAGTPAPMWAFSLHKAVASVFTVGEEMRTTHPHARPAVATCLAPRAIMGPAVFAYLTDADRAKCTGFQPCDAEWVKNLMSAYPPPPAQAPIAAVPPPPPPRPLPEPPAPPPPVLATPPVPPSAPTPTQPVQPSLFDEDSTPVVREATVPAWMKPPAPPPPAPVTPATEDKPKRGRKKAEAAEGGEDKPKRGRKKAAAAEDRPADDAAAASPPSDVAVADTLPPLDPDTDLLSPEFAADARVAVAASAATVAEIDSWLLSATQMVRRALSLADHHALPTPAIEAALGRITHARLLLNPEKDHD